MATYAQTVPVSNAAILTGRVLSTLLILFFLFDGGMKLVKPEPVLKACAELGIPEDAIVGIGVVLLASTVLYAVPATAVLGAILLTGYLGGAIMTHVRMGGPVFSIVFGAVFGMLVWFGLFLRDARLRTLIPIRRDV
jgi:hypothetical protein